VGNRAKEAQAYRADASLERTIADQIDEPPRFENVIVPLMRKWLHREAADQHVVVVERQELHRFRRVKRARVALEPVLETDLTLALVKNEEEVRPRLAGWRLAPIGELVDEGRGRTLI
jgi:hypothetical protein